MFNGVAFGQELPRLAVTEFTVNTDTPKVQQDAVAIRNAVQSNFTATARYEVVARAEIDQLVQNQQIALSAISSKENLRKLEIANINYIVTGTVDAIGDDYSVTINILDVGNGRFAHSAMDLIGSGSRDIFNGINSLVRTFMAGLRSEGGTVVSAAAARQERASASADTDTGIRVRSNIAGTLYFQDEETATLWDNDEYLIAVTRPGTYTVKMSFGNGRESSRTIVITGRGIVEAQFGTPPVVQNLRVEAAAGDSVTLSWDSVGTGLSYKAYYHTENNPQTARVSGTEISGTTTTIRYLNSNTSYYFWISAVDVGIEGEKSAALSQKTDMPVARNLRAGAVDGNSVALSWDSVGTGLSYRVYYQTENNPQAARVSGGIVNGTTTTIRNLTPSTSYYFWISAVAGGTEGRKSAVLSMKTSIPLVGTWQARETTLEFDNNGNFVITNYSRHQQDITRNTGRGPNANYLTFTDIKGTVRGTYKYTNSSISLDYTISGTQTVDRSPGTNSRNDNYTERGNCSFSYTISVDGKQLSIGQTPIFLLSLGTGQDPFSVYITTFNKR
jgi:fibronectin type 3 domain-containing protein